MAGDQPRASGDDLIYFFGQGDDLLRNAWSSRRPKKVLDEQTLLTLSSKKNLSSLAKLSQELDPSAALLDRLNAVLKAAAVPTSNSMTSLPNISTASAAAAAFPSASRSQIEWEAFGVSVSAPAAHTFTDTRLQALKYLTEDMIRELDETISLVTSTEGGVQLALPAQVICDWHADWTDLTERADYSRCPMWHTKNGKDTVAATGSTGGAHKGKKAAADKKDGKKRRKSLRRNSSFESPEDAAAATTPGTVHGKTPKQSKSTTARRQSKVTSSLAEGGPMTTGRRQSNYRVHSMLGSALNSHRHASISVKNFSPNAGGLRAPSNIALNHKPEMTNSRVITSQNSTGYSLNYQLSSKLFREKGWTVLQIEREETIHNNEKSILTHLKNSMKSINECREYNDMFGLSKLCRLRFYGDHRRDQIEKYKTSHMRPKKSAFAMSILRNELPRALDLQHMLELLSNPNLAQLSIHETCSQGGQSQQALITSKLDLSRPGSGVSSITLTLPKPPPLLSSHTNDGTTCVYYPNGQLAIVIANVFGFFVESASSSSAVNNHQSHTAQSMFSDGGKNFNSGSFSISGSSTIASSLNLCLKCQPLRDAYTTIVYDSQPNVASRSSRGKDSIIESNDSSTVAKQKPKPSSREKQRILCVISALGYCVVYRRNGGSTRFICTEYGGCLCNRNGSVSFQWKWDELKLRDYERFKNELSLDLNEHVRLEYRNPSNIKLKFSCDKERLEFDLSSSKPASSRLHEMLNRTVCDFPMQSKMAQVKIATNAKANILQAYRQNHLQQQQQAANSIRKTSQVLDQSVRGSNDLVGSRLVDDAADSRLESILESMVSYRDVPVMKDLLTTQKKIRHLLDDWLNYCRTSLNIMAPGRYILPELNKKPSPGRAKFKTNSPLDRHRAHSAEVLRSSFDFAAFETVNDSNQVGSLLASRSKSAFIGNRFDHLKISNAEKLRILKSLVNSRSEISKKLPFMWSSFEADSWKGSSNTAAVKRGGAQTYRSTFSNNSGLLNSSPRRPYFTNEDLNLMCPVSVHDKLAHNRFEVPECRCRKLAIPLVRDLEFDYFIRLLPAEQLVAVLIANSDYPKNKMQEMVEELYLAENRGRLQPCKESFRDGCRYIIYDLKYSTEHSDHTVPLLQTRHNIVPGMVLVYQNSKLLFCDHIFNGYGYGEHDFVKQLEKCREDAKKGKFLPYNFRFDRPIGKHGRRTPWGGQIGGLEPCLFESFTEEQIKPISPVGEGAAIKSPRTSRNLPKIVFTRDESPVLLPKLNKNSLET